MIGLIIWGDSFNQINHADFLLKCKVIHLSAMFLFELLSLGNVACTNLRPLYNVSDSLAVLKAPTKGQQITKQQCFVSKIMSWMGLQKNPSIDSAEEISMNFLYFSFTDFNHFNAKKDNLGKNEISPIFNCWQTLLPISNIRVIETLLPSIKYNFFALWSRRGEFDLIILEKYIRLYGR